MPRIRKIHVKNFRALREFEWFPSAGFNCLIGSGDTGKSTILDAIDLTLGARRSYSFSDTDFFRLDTTVPIEIWVTLGDLPDELKNVEVYGNFLRGFDSATRIIHDEPCADTETVLTIKLTVNEDLDPDWCLHSDRAEADGYERRLIWRHRELVSAARLGATSYHHLSWGNRSILNKFSEQSLDVSSTLAQISRQTREAFAGQQPDNISEVLARVQKVAASLGVSVGELQAQLDIKGVSLTTGAIGLHDEDNTPLRQLGTGSTRLLISGLHKAASNSKILLVDEAEYGLEPFRISRLLNELGSKEEQPDKQVFITTHSPYVLRELRAEQLHVLRPQAAEGQHYSQQIYNLNAGEQQQATLRACAEAFLSKKVIVCEGKTEIGLIRGVDLFGHAASGASIYTHGVYCADGNGDSLFSRAHVFASLGYSVAIFKDSDKSAEHAKATQAAIASGITVYEWGNGCAVEDAIFGCCPADQIPALLSLAVSRKSHNSVDATIRHESANQYGLQECLTRFNDAMRTVLAASAKSKSWFKDIEPAEVIGREILSPNYQNFSPGFTNVISGLFQFARTEVGA